jgi:hypothetical protein
MNDAQRSLKGFEAQPALGHFPAARRCHSLVWTGYTANTK